MGIHTPFFRFLNCHPPCSFDYFGYKTLERSYLLKLHGEVFERPQFMFMRVALGIHFHDIEAALETYDLMSRRLFTHATPTLFNSGTPRPQLSSCFLLTMKGDSIEGIYDTLKVGTSLKMSQSSYNRTNPDPSFLFAVLRLHFQVRWWYWPVHPQHSLHGQLHSRYQRPLQRHCADVARVQRYCPLR